jgi:CHASE2 domain-containing sensor protein
VAFGNSSDIDLAVLRVEGLPHAQALKLCATGQAGIPFTTAGFRTFGTKQESKQYRVLQGRLGKATGIAGKAANFAQTWDLEITEAGAPDKLEPGCSGSPVMDQSGRVLGVATHRLDTTGKQGQAIAIRELERIWLEMPASLRDSLAGVVAVPPPPPQPWLGRLPGRLLGDRTLHRSLSLSGGIALLILIVRFLGMMQSWELGAFDLLLRSRLENPERDKRLLIIEVDQAAIDQFADQSTAISLSDPTLLNLLQVLDRYQPKVIGLDIYRKSPVAQAYQPTLGQRLQRDSRLIGVCKVPDPQDNRDPAGVTAPPELMQDIQQRVGFSDFLPDSGRVVRRHLIQMSLSDRKPPCLTPYAFSLQLAAKYLDTEPQVSGTAYSLKGVEFPPIAPYTGGYQGIDAAGHQLLLNYRSVQGSPRNIAETVTLQNFLSGQVPFQTLENRIVLIGVTAPDKGDDWPTPYQEEIPGVMIQAQMTSQLLSAVAQKRPLLWVWPQTMEALWIVGWSMVGGLLVWRFTRLRWLSFAVLSAWGMLVFSCWLTLSVAAGWLPLIPAALALGGSAIASRIITYTGEKS